MTHDVRGGGQPLSVRPLEFNLLATLLPDPGRVYTREELVRQVWEIEHGSVRTVEDWAAKAGVDLCPRARGSA